MTLLTVHVVLRFAKLKKSKILYKTSKPLKYSKIKKPITLGVCSSQHAIFFNSVICERHSCPPDNRVRLCETKRKYSNTRAIIYKAGFPRWARWAMARTNICHNYSYSQIHIVKWKSSYSQLAIPYNQNYWQALYLAIYSKNAIDGILNWRL